MKIKEKLLKDLMKICREAIDADDMNDDTEGTYLDTCAYKALFNYTSVNNLKKLKEYVLHEMANNKKKNKHND